MELHTLVVCPVCDAVLENTKSGLPPTKIVDAICGNCQARGYKDPNLEKGLVRHFWVPRSHIFECAVCGIVKTIYNGAAICEKGSTHVHKAHSTDLPTVPSSRV